MRCLQLKRFVARPIPDDLIANHQLQDPDVVHVVWKTPQFRPNERAFNYVLLDIFTRSL